MYTWGQLRRELVEFVTPSKRDVSFDTIDRVLNSAYSSILDSRRWSGLSHDAVIPVFGRITAGTVSIANGSTDITLTGATWSTLITGRRIRLSPSNDWYVIAWETSTTGKLDRPFAGATVTEGGYEIFQNLYELGEAARSITSAGWAETNWPLKRATQGDLDQLDPWRVTYGTPSRYAAGPDTREGGTPVIRTVEFWPVPDVDGTAIAKLELAALGFDGNNTDEGPMRWVSAAAILAKAQAELAASPAVYGNAVLAKVYLDRYDEEKASMDREENQRIGTRRIQHDPYYNARPHGGRRF